MIEKYAIVQAALKPRQSRQVSNSHCVCGFILCKADGTFEAWKYGVTAGESARCVGQGLATESAAEDLILPPSWTEITA